MIILSIESSCDETAVAVVEDICNIRSNIVLSQIDAHRVYGGVVPEIASRMHTEAISGITDKAVEDAMVAYNDIDAVAVTYAPGLIGSLLCGISFAKGLAFSLNKPLIPVHHLRAHIASCYINNPKLTPPFLALVISGGHSHIISVKDYCEYEILGRTRDDAAGEAFDKVARYMGLPYPGGIEIDRLSKTGDKNAYAFPKVKFADAPYDFSFSGVKTSVINLINKFNQKEQAYSRADIAASFNKTVADTLVEKFIAAAFNNGFEKACVCGGVCANSLFRESVKIATDKNNIELFLPELNLCGDNAVMVGVQAFYEYRDSNISDMFLNGYANKNIEENFER